MKVHILTKDEMAVLDFNLLWCELSTAEDYPAELLAARREAILSHYRNLTPEQQANVCEELAELECSDDTLSGSLRDAGFGSGGAF